MRLKKSSSVDICVTYFGDKYSTKYLDNLEAGIGRNYSGNFNFIVKTDCPNRHWDKLSFFDNDRRTVIMDIDMMVINSVDHIFNYKAEFAAFPRWWRDNHSINGGLYVFDPSEKTALVKEKFYQQPELWINQYSNKTGTKWMGEQLFVDESLPDITRLNGQWLGVYVDGVDHKGTIQSQSMFEARYYVSNKTHMMSELYKFKPHVSLVHFIYDQKIEQHKQWIQDLWNGHSSV